MNLPKFNFDFSKFSLPDFDSIKNNVSGILSSKKHTSRIVEINLIPDVKQEVLVARRQRNQITTIFLIACAAALAVVLILLMIVFIVQGLIISNQRKDITSKFNEYTSQHGIKEVLTVQNQLVNLKEMHDNKMVTSRMFVIIAQLIQSNDLKIKLNKIEVEPHNKRVMIDAFSEKGFIELERLKKTIEDANVYYVNQMELNRIAGIDDKTNLDDEDEDKEDTKADDQESETSLIDYLDQAKESATSLTEEVSLLRDPAYGESIAGKKVLTFSIGFAVDESFFKHAELQAMIKEIDYQDVTDSLLAIPSDIFGSIKTDDSDDDNDNGDGIIKYIRGINNLIEGGGASQNDDNDQGEQE